MTSGDYKVTAANLRMFFALLPDPATRVGVEACARALNLGSAARIVLSGNFHVTLAFIGEVSAAHIPALQRIGSAHQSGEFSLRFDAYEYWPKPEVVVAVARTFPAVLQSLWQRLHEALSADGLALDPKRLRPHVTLARKVSQPPVLPAMSSFEWPARDFSLLRSDTGGPQSAYTVEGTWPLLDKSEKA